MGTHVFVACSLFLLLQRDVGILVLQVPISAEFLKLLKFAFYCGVGFFYLKIRVQTPKTQQNETMKTEVKEPLRQEGGKSPLSPGTSLHAKLLLDSALIPIRMSSCSESPSLQEHILKPVYFDQSDCKTRPNCQQIAALFSKIHLLL